MPKSIKPEIGELKNRSLTRKKCIHCFFCWAYCPDNAVIVDAEAGKMLAFNYDYCKGCGICAAACPAKGAITMVPER